MKKLWVPLFVFIAVVRLLFGAKTRRAAGDRSAPFEDSIAHQTQVPAETTLYFPDYVDGGGWLVQLVLSNVDPAATTEVRAEVYDPEGQPVLDLFDSDMTLEVPLWGAGC